MKSSAKVLKVCLDNTVMADDSIAGIVNAVGLSGTPGLSGLGSNLGMSSAAAVAKSYKTQPFNNSAVYASTDGSFESLVSNILTTNTAIPSGLASNWTSNAQRIYEMVEAIAPAIASLESSAETEFVAQAIARLQLIQAAGSEYAANSAALAGNNTGLAALASSSQLMAAAAQAAAIAAEAVSPAAVKAVKEAFVSSCPMYVNSYLPATNPTFVKLLPDLTDVTGSDFSINGPPAPTAPEFADAPMPAGLASIFANNGYTNLANARGPQDVLQQFGKPNPDMLNAIASGATPTQVASAQAPTLPPPGALNAPGHECRAGRWPPWRSRLRCRRAQRCDDRRRLRSRLRRRRRPRRIRWHADGRDRRWWPPSRRVAAPAISRVRLVGRRRCRLSHRLRLQRWPRRRRRGRLRGSAGYRVHRWLRRPTRRSGCHRFCRQHRRSARAARRLHGCANVAGPRQR
ncbi:hypothetical protein [Corynebacterium sp. UMB2355A]|uniref:hypothetical protein n=1 Tax=Corynebacterium sp. UMB2355A TaxID=3081222 RepID=UPI0029FECDE5|nr:hypothetical protein [Corynebacterium sp. UMB2355A]WPJ91790.1 hypothetical protein R0V12_05610 [Corynebacterium sp. UMB2355A]